ncbi:hypothetical protein SKAU_G00139230 [Synaphobranchus kaupii]|uniref:Uncharacterized protein n=1 Tax=Synaphobranchus kaupii TaxID=118154 RepID=A0A9Q1FS04_SYNKA|nr:hypothetical protein SKAU_G00139230 [Synaphobranchus kaupii]
MKKPEPVEDYLEDLVEELVRIQERGIEHEGILFEVKINAVICDSPARAFAKCIKGHNAYHGCERCEAVATRVDGRMVYTSHATFERRTDDKFSQVYLSCLSLIWSRDRHIWSTSEDLLKHFVDGSTEFYGDTFPVYNIHSLQHLHEDAASFKCSLNDISAFPFENHMQAIKKMVRSGQNPLAQVSKRIAEQEYAKPSTRSSLKRCYVSTKSRDGCFILADEIAFVREKRGDGMLVADVIRLDDAHDLFEKPCRSKLINIAYVEKEMDVAQRRVLEKKELLRKAVCLPFSEGFAIFPLLHNMD